MEDSRLRNSRSSGFESAVAQLLRSAAMSSAEVVGEMDVLAARLSPLYLADSDLSFDHDSEMGQDINLKFSAFVYHMSGLN